MFALDESKKCTIIETSFLEDLLTYTVNKGQISWSDGTTTPYTIKKDIFASIDTNFWTPNFISDDSLIDTKMISHYGSVVGDTDLPSGRIGIENMLSFSPKFKSWTASGSMSVDWILNRSNIPYCVVAGLSHWSTTSTAITGNIQDFPKYSRLAYGGSEYIKLDDETIRRISPDKVQQALFNSGGSISFRYTDNQRDTKIQELVVGSTQPVFTLVGSDKKRVWVADGDQVLYFLNRAEMAKRFPYKIGPQSYISGSLYKYYTNIYNALTKEEPLIDINNFRYLRVLRLYKKLAHSLATSPFVSEFFIQFLSQPSSVIEEAIRTYIYNENNNLQADLDALMTVLTVISQEYSKYEIEDKNVIYNNDQLFTKLINKYGAKLVIPGTGSVAYKNRLAHGDSVIVEEIGNYFIDKSTTNSIITNNKTIGLSKLSVKTNMGPIESSIDLNVGGVKTNNIQLYDTIKPEVKPESNLNIVLDTNNNVSLYQYKQDADKTRIPNVREYDPNNNVFYFALGAVANNRDGWLAGCPRLRVVNLDLNLKYTNSRFPLRDENTLSREFSCVWQRVSGPELTFVDFDKINTNKTYSRAYGTEVIMVPSTTGKYVVRCTISGPYGSYTKTKTIFIVDGRELIGRIIGRPAVLVITPNAGFGAYLDENNIPATMLKISQSVFDSLELNTDYPMIRPTQADLAEVSYERIPIPINRDNLKVFIAGTDAIAIHRNGLFVPIRSNYYVDKVVSNARPIEKLQNNNFQFVFYPNGSLDQPNTSNSSISITYQNNNTTLKLDRIILKNLRNDTPECSQCYSLYHPKFRSYVSTTRRPMFLRSNKAPDEFSLQKYIYDATAQAYRELEVVVYPYPVISTDLSPPIKTYGGYGHQVLNKIGINTIDSLPRPGFGSNNNGIVANAPKVLPPVTGYNLDYKTDFSGNTDRYKFCYEQIVAPKGYIDFSKGTFLPSSGWVVGDNRNLSSVLKFNPGARQSYSFVGPGILGLSNYTNTSTIKASVFSSSIGLGIMSEIQWDPGPSIAGENCLPDDEEQRRRAKAEAKGIHFFKSQLTQELADHWISGPNRTYHHGYRILSGTPKLPERNISSISSPVNDEFEFSSDEQTNTFFYNFAKVGYHKPIDQIDKETREFIDLYIGEQQSPNPGSGPDPNADKVRDYIEKNNDLGLLVPRINFAEIKDIEVKLNFLNYVNTKNLMIWLEVSPSSSERENMKKECTYRGCTIKSQIKADNIFIDQFVPSNIYRKFPNEDGTSFAYPLSETIDAKNITYNDILKKLTDFNSYDVPQVLKIYLLNQETIQNKEYNFSVKFSDTANKNNVFYDHNLFGFGKTNGDQNIISNNSSIRPTTNIPGFTTPSNCFANNIIKSNNLNINNNTFNKFANKNLFQGFFPTAKCVPMYGPYDSSTTFTLKIAVLDEEDEMLPLDTLVNNEIYTNLDSVENKLSSANLFNNLCSWELILHTDNVKKPVTSLVNSLTNYGGTDALGLIEYGGPPKYPGYSFIADLSDSKFLLPLVNMNAPHTFFQNYNACEYADNEIIGKGVMINGPRFPTEAIVMIIAGTAVGGMSGTLVGALVGGLGPTYYAGFDLIYNYFRESRIVPLLETAQRETFDVEYDAYPMGSSDKVLINASIDGLFWYKLEASIFKLSNTPALPLQEYQFLKSDNSLFKFGFKTITKNSDFIDPIFVPIISPTAKYLNSQEQEENNNEEDNDSAAEEEQEDDSAEQEVPDYDDIDNFIYDNYNFLNITGFAIFNKLVHNPTIFESKALGAQLIIIENSMPYYLTNINDTIKIACFAEETEQEYFSSYIVESKALVYKSEKYQTVLAVRGPRILNCSHILLPEDVFVLYDNSSTIDGGSESPVSLYGLVNDQPPNDFVPSFTVSTNSVGSYGDGSIIKDKNILSRKIQLNKLEPIYSSLNNFTNDKFYYNALQMNVSGIAETVSDNKLQAYPVYYDQDNNEILVDDTNFLAISDIVGDYVKIYATEEDFDIDRYTSGIVKIENDERITLTDNSVFIKANVYSISRITLQEQILNKISGISGYFSVDGDVSGLKDYKSYQKDKKYNLMYIKAVDNDYISSMSRSTSGTIKIENNYTYKKNIQSISSEQLSILTQRLNTLNQTKIQSLDNLVGKRNSTASILNSNSISYISQHYESLDEDPVSCSEPAGAKDAGCSKLRTFNKLKQLIYERNDILQVLADQAIKRANILYDKQEPTEPGGEPTYNKSVAGIIEFEDSSTIKLAGLDQIWPKDDSILITYSYQLNPEKQIYRNSPGGILADTSIDIKTNSDGSLVINYINSSNNYYWINIDPKQGCSIAEEMRPKVLKSIKYVCEFTNPVTSAVGVGQQIVDFNNICPDWSAFNEIDSSDVNFDVDAKSDGITYKIKDSVVQAQKKALEDKGCGFGWNTKIINRKYRIHSERNIKNILPNTEFLITTTETYEVAMTPLEAAQQQGLSAAELINKSIIKNDQSGDAYGKLVSEGSAQGPIRVYNIFNLDNVNNLKVQFRKAPRMIRGIDAMFSVLRYGENNSYRPQSRPPLDPLDTFGIGRTDSLINDFYQWVCYEASANSGKIRKAKTPEIFQLFDEMMFRAFFGSVDGIEHKTERMKSLYPFEMIPYEYFTKPT